MNNIDIDILEEFINNYKKVQEKYKDDKIQAEIERSCYFEEVPYQAISNLISENKELKEKNKWKPIKEYNRQKYDWVLVKYFDGDYECVPEVAEQRIDGKWYTSEKQIPFEVKYFFDMKSLLGKE